MYFSFLNANCSVTIGLSFSHRQCVWSTEVKIDYKKESNLKTDIFKSSSITASLDPGCRGLRVYPGYTVQRRRI